MPVSTVQSYTHFLKRDSLYDSVKPYSLRFTAPDGLSRANILLEKHNIDVRDIRRDPRRPTFEENGCVLLDDFSTQMKYTDFDHVSVIKDVYLREVADRLKDLFDAQHVQIFEHTVRKRHQTFPISTGEPYTWNQPTSIAHVDTTVPWSVAMAQQLNPDRAQKLKQSRIQCVNFWKPIVGPVQDWPLALCSATSIDAKTQFEPCDLVYPDYVVENRQVYHSDTCDWFYISDQMPNEAWVFMQSDTEPNGIKPVAHTAFPLTENYDPSMVPSRESIEVRALIYYGGFEDREGVDVQHSITPS